jgi:hypothetical protein
MANKVHAMSTALRKTTQQVDRLLRSRVGTTKLEARKRKALSTQKQDREMRKRRRMLKMEAQRMTEEREWA